jgi:hypothetical protein
VHVGTGRKSKGYEPALLTRAELGWLQGEKQISQSYERKMRFMINAKLRILTQSELPLLMQNGFNVTTSSNAATISSNAADTINWHSLNEISGRGSPSLVGRGIANPMSERTRGFESHSPRLTQGFIDKL